MSLKKMSREECELARILNILAALTEPDPGQEHDSDQEKLKRELWKRFEGYRDSKPDVCRYVIQRLMAAASARNDEAELSALLDRARELRRETGVEIGLLGRPLPAVEEPAGDKIDFDTERNFWSRVRGFGAEGVALTARPVHFAALAARLDVRRDCSAGMLLYEQVPFQDETGQLGSCRFCGNRSMFNRFITNLPEHYAAIIAGADALVRWYWDQGAYGKGFWKKKEDSPPPLIRFPRLENTGNSIHSAARRCSSVITAALYSGSEEMLRFFLERSPAEQVEYRREMLFPLSRAPRRMQELFLEAYPKIWDQITLRQILLYPSSLLLRGYIERHGPLPAGTRLRNAAWNYLIPARRLNEPMCGRMPDWCADFINFFCVLLENTRDKGDWWEFLRAYAEWFFEIRIKAPKYWAFFYSRLDVASCLVQLPDTLYELLCDLTRRGLLPEGTDITPLISSDIRYKRDLLRTGVFVPHDGLPDDPIRYKLDIYSFNTRKAQKFTNSSFLTVFCPTRILPERDNITKQGVLRQLWVPTIENGYLTAVNYPFLQYDRNGPKAPPKEVRARLLDLSTDCPLEERYQDI